MKYFTFLIVLCFTALTTHSQTVQVPKTPFTTMYLDVWQTATAHCLEVAHAMPEELYSYKPTELSKTFGEQMVHMAYTVELLTKRYVQGKEVKPNAPDASELSKAQILQMLEHGFSYVTEVINTVEQEQLDQTCVMYHSGNTVSRAFAFFYVLDHMNNHRAKANLYIRMNDIQPPEYTW